MTLPPQATVVSATTDGRGGALTLAATSRPALVGWLRAELWRIGMTLELDSGPAFHFRSAGWSGQVATDDTYVTMTWSVGDWVTGRVAADLGLTAGVPSLLRYLPGAVPSNVRSGATGASYDLVGRTPAELLAFYRSELSPIFTVTGDHTENGVTTLTFTDRDYVSVITSTEAGFRMVHTRRR